MADTNPDVNEANFDLESRYYATDSQSRTTASFSRFQKNVDPPVPTTPTDYVVAIGKVAESIICEIPEGAHGHVEIVPQPNPSEVTGSENSAFPPGQPVKVYAIYGEHFTCPLDTGLLWNDGPDGQKRFQAPSIQLHVKTVVTKVVDGFILIENSTLPEARICSMVEANYQREASTSFQSPPPSKDRYAVDFNGHPPEKGADLHWDSCEVSPAAIAQVEYAAANITDIQEASDASRNAFVGGASIGFVGALLVEILGMAIDLRVGDGNGDDPSQLGEPGGTPDMDEPYNPRSRGYL